MHFSHLSLFWTLAAAAATPVSATSGIYKSPQAKSFITVRVHVGLPVNTTTPDGPVGLFRTADGNVTGQFTGRLAPNLSTVVERILPGSSGAHSTVFTNWVLESNAKSPANQPERILARLEGLTTYANNALHGFGSVRLSTDIEHLKWINWATFLIEWEGQFNTGIAAFEIFHITSGGRLDGKKIPALSPQGGN
ncbi:hypothetical protein QQS21_002289 [Conoideocrella luteorostrata]|uniref:Uncharacterized protein n=1 Tax=Conoideocrella luteorostrata TaxID=1105319 RepID=A0AAJ0CZL7_9HYPO|nr:hypothetical protein QQS21_002289 [Conoideocrella luteorostrata]